MKSLVCCWVLIVLLLGAARGSETPKKIEVDWTPFEPPCEDFFDCQDKFRHPDELVLPKFLYPFEMRRSTIDGEAVILVRIDNSGYPQKLSVLCGTHQLFIRSAIFALEKARWVAGLGSVCFYYRAVFRIKEEGSSPR